MTNRSPWVHAWMRGSVTRAPPGKADTLGRRPLRPPHPCPRPPALPAGAARRAPDRSCPARPAPWHDGTGPRGAAELRVRGLDLLEGPRRDLPRLLRRRPLPAAGRLLRRLLLGGHDLLRWRLLPGEPVLRGAGHVLPLPHRVAPLRRPLLPERPGVRPERSMRRRLPGGGCGVRWGLLRRRPSVPGGDVHLRLPDRPHGAGPYGAGAAPGAGPPRPAPATTAAADVLLRRDHVRWRVLRRRRGLRHLRGVHGALRGRPAFVRRHVHPALRPRFRPQCVHVCLRVQRAAVRRHLLLGGPSLRL